MAAIPRNELRFYSYKNERERIVVDTTQLTDIKRKRKFLFAEILAFLLISVQLALYVFMWLHLLRDPSIKGMDFISFYTAGRIARQSNYHLLFDLDTQRTVQTSILTTDIFAGGVNLSQHPPYIAPLLSLLAIDDFVHSYILWTLVRLVVMVACGELIRHFLIHSGWDSFSALLGTLGSLCFFPFFLGLLGGQDTAFIMLGLLLWMFGMLEVNEIRAGFGLALASLSPLVAGALGLPLLATGRKASIWFILAMLLLVLYSLSLIGFQGGKDFIGLLHLSSQGEGLGLNQPAMYNLLGFLLRNFPDLSKQVSRLISWGAFITSITFIIFWWNKRKNLRVEHLGIAVVLNIFTLPHLHAHGLSYLLLPLLGMVTILYKRGFKTSALILIPVISTILLFSAFMISSINYALYYLLMSVLFGGLWISLRNSC